MRIYIFRVTQLHIVKKRLVLNGTYVFDIEDGENEIPVLVAVLTMNYVASH